MLIREERAPGADVFRVGWIKPRGQRERLEPLERQRIVLVKFYPVGDYVLPGVREQAEVIAKDLQVLRSALISIHSSTQLTKPLIPL